MKHWLSLALVTVSVACVAQSSFQKRIPIDTAYATYIVQLQDSSYVMTIQTFPTGLLLCVDKDGAPRWGWELNHNYLLLAIEELTLDQDDNILLRIYYHYDQFGFHDLIKINSSGDILWRVPIFNRPRVFGFYHNALSVTPNNHYLSCDSPYGSIHECTMINSDGDLLWSKKFEAGAASNITTTCALSDGNIIIGQILGNNETVLITINPLGNLIGSITVPLHQITIMETQDNDLILFGRTQTNQQNVTRVTPQGQLVWSKNIDGVQNTWRNHMSNSGDEILLTFNQNNGPQSVMHVDAQGDLIASLAIPGISEITGGTTTTHDHGIAFVASLKKTMTHPQDVIITKLSDTYELADCEVLTNCLSLRDTMISIGPGIDIQITDVTIEETGDIAFTPYAFTTEDYCVPFEYPDPFFELPDTVCVGTCIAPTQLAQTNANTWSWTAPGFLPDTSSMQEPGDFCAEQAGAYLITQVISLAGCVDSFSRTIKVVNPLQLSFILDSVICPHRTKAIPLPPDATLRQLTMPDGSVLDIPGDTLFLGPLEQDACFSLRLGRLELCDTIIDFCLTVQTPLTTMYTVFKCIGDHAVIHGDTIYSPGIYTGVFTDVYGCDSTSIVTLIYTTSPQVNAEVIMPTCAGSPDGLISLSGTPGLTYQWGDGSTLGLRTGLTAGDWQVTVSDGPHCDTIISITLHAPAPFTVELPSHIQLVAGGSVQLLPIVQPSGAYTFTWSPGTGLNCTDCPSPMASPSVSTAYSLVVIDEQGCQQTASIFITIISPDEIASKLFFPTAFSPNEDGINDLWQVLSSEDILVETIEIYDRWGGLVFQCRDAAAAQCAWDGTWRGRQVAPGTYVWHARVLVSGYGAINQKGEVTVVR